MLRKKVSSSLLDKLAPPFLCYNIFLVNIIIQLDATVTIRDGYLLKYRSIPLGRNRVRQRLALLPDHT